MKNINKGINTTIFEQKHKIDVIKPVQDDRSTKMA